MSLRNPVVIARANFNKPRRKPLARTVLSTKKKKELTINMFARALTFTSAIVRRPLEFFMICGANALQMSRNMPAAAAPIDLVLLLWSALVDLPKRARTRLLYIHNVVR